MRFAAVPITIPPQQIARDRGFVSQVHAAQTTGRQIVTEQRDFRRANPAAISRIPRPAQPPQQQQLRPNTAPNQQPQRPNGQPGQPGQNNRPGQQQPAAPNRQDTIRARRRRSAKDKAAPRSRARRAQVRVSSRHGTAEAGPAAHRPRHATRRRAADAATAQRTISASARQPSRRQPGTRHTANAAHRIAARHTAGRPAATRRRTTPARPAAAPARRATPSRAAQARAGSGAEGKEEAVDWRAQHVSLAPPSLRAQRSNPESLRGKILDCFASLAMTAAERPHASPRSQARTFCSRPCRSSSTEAASRGRQRLQGRINVVGRQRWRRLRCGCTVQDLPQRSRSGRPG